MIIQRKHHASYPKGISEVHARRPYRGHRKAVSPVVLIILALGFQITLFASCKKVPPEKQPLVVGWDEPLITKGQFQERLKESYGECSKNNSPPCMRVRNELLSQMVEEVVVIHYAEAKGWKPPAEEIERSIRELLSNYQGADDILEQVQFDRKGAWRTALARWSMARIMEGLAKGVRVTDEEVVRYYRDHRELFVAPREVKVRQIVVAKADDALQIRNRLKKGEDFSKLAQEHSLTPEGAVGGDLGYLSPGQMPAELGDAVFSLKEGAVSDVIPSPYGFHIIRVEDHREPRELKLYEVKEAIERRIYLNKLRQAYKGWLTKAYQEANVKVLDPALRLQKEIQGDGGS